MATPVLNNGIFLRDTSYKASSHVDSYHLTQMLGNPEPMDMGPIDLWAMTQKVEMPLYQMASFGGKNTIMVDNARGEYKWQTPIAQDLPYIVADIEPTTENKGVDGTLFRVKINKRTFGHGDIITYDKYNGLELYITADDILPAGDGFIYTVQLVNNNNTAILDNKYLAKGTKFFRKGSARGEYGERFSDIETGSGFREFYNFVGGAEAHVHYSISSRADLMIKGGLNADGTVPVTEIWRNFNTDPNNPSVPSIEGLVASMGKAGAREAFENGTLTRTFITNMEAAHLSKIATDIETYLMWGKGGRVKQDGPDDIRLSVGLWAQLDNSFKRVYNKSSFTLDMFKSELYNFYQGKVELKWFYQNGTMDYMGRTQGFASTGNFNGYRVMMSQTMPAIWVKDPTKVLKIVMRNPITGGSF